MPRRPIAQLNSENLSASRSRRAFLYKGAALTGSALVGNALTASASAQGADDNLPPHVPKWMKLEGKPLGTPPYGLPASHEARITRVGREARMPGSGGVWTPLQSLHGTITPNGLVFERSHAGVPDIHPDEHRLMVHGLVRKPMLFTMEDLMRFPSVSRIHFIECSGNTLREWRSPVEKSVQLSHGLLSCCEWTGVPLSTLFDEVGLQDAARWVLAEGADAAAMTRSVPIEKCLEDALLVYAQNGEMLRPENGYPLRLFLPGFEGNMSVKWLRRLKVGTEPFMTREETSKYTDSVPDGSARQFTFTMDVKSVITYPAADHRLKQKGFYEISGLAWSGGGRIRRVDVSSDGGKNWREAALQEPVLHRALTRFRLPWMWEGGSATLQSRAIDESGQVQPTRKQLVAVRGYNSIYHYNAIQSWQVSNSGEVRNVHV